MEQALGQLSVILVAGESEDHDGGFEALFYVFELGADLLVGHN